MKEESPRVAMLLTQEEAEHLLCLLLLTEPSERTDAILCRLADVQRLLGRTRCVDSESVCTALPCCAAPSA